MNKIQSNITKIIFLAVALGLLFSSCEDMAVEPVGECFREITYVSEVKYGLYTERVVHWETNYRAYTGYFLVSAEDFISTSHIVEPYNWEYSIEYGQAVDFYTDYMSEFYGCTTQN